MTVEQLQAVLMEVQESENKIRIASTMLASMMDGEIQRLRKEVYRLQVELATARAENILLKEKAR